MNTKQELEYRLFKLWCQRNGLKCSNAMSLHKYMEENERVKN